MKLGIEVLLSTPALVKKIENKRVALVAHPASVSHDLTHSLDLLVKNKINVTCCYGPQHGMRGEKQDNMVESSDYLDPIHKIPVFSLYGESRRPTADSVKSFDVCLFDLQDVGTRIYTFLTTLLYMMEACHEHQKSLWILDRPNPAGREIEGLTLVKGWESFVGAAEIPMRHGLTLGEMALWFKNKFDFKMDLQIIKMEDYSFSEPWPRSLSWVNPSPNASNVMMTRCFPGTVMFEGTTLSEARGTTRPLEMFGAPDIDFEKVLKKMRELKPEWMMGCLLRVCYFEPTFNKHAKSLCQGVQIHVDTDHYVESLFKPFRLISLFFKSLRLEYPQYPIWRNFHYEYVYDKLAIDVINGSEILRNWVDDLSSNCENFDKLCKQDELKWENERKEFLLY